MTVEKALGALNRLFEKKFRASIIQRTLLSLEFQLTNQKLATQPSILLQNTNTADSMGKSSQSLQQEPHPNQQVYDNVEEGQQEVSLQPRRGFIYQSLYFYKNFWCPLSIYNYLPSPHQWAPFQAENTDIIVASKPKSGTTWLKSLSFAILTRNKFPVLTAEDQLRHPLASTNPHLLVLSLEFDILNPGESAPLVHLPDQLPSRRLYSTHLPYQTLPDSIKNSGCKIVYICRNPLDALVSDWHFCCKGEETEEDSLHKLEEMVDSYCRGEEAFGPHWVSVLGYWNESLENPQRLMFMRYEELKRDEISSIKRLAEFLGAPFTLDEEEKGVIQALAKLCSLGTLKELEVNKSGNDFPHVKNHKFFRNGAVGDSVNYLSPSQAGRLNKVLEEKFHGSGFEL